MTDKEITDLLTDYVGRIGRRLGDSPAYTATHGVVFLLGDTEGRSIMAVHGNEGAIVTALANMLADSPALAAALAPKNGAGKEETGETGDQAAEPKPAGRRRRAAKPETEGEG